MAKRLTTKQIRMRLATREACDNPACPGWAVFNEAEVQRCDTCCPAGLTDADVASLPEAAAALAAVLERMARNNTPITVRVPAARYADYDDCLEAAAEDYAAEHDLEGWDLSPRWADDQRDEILLSVPAGLAPVEVYLDTANGPVVEYGDHDEEAVEAAVPVRLVGRNDAINKDPPWHRHQWSGAVQAIDDGVDLTDPWPEPARYGEVPSNVARIVECGATNCDDWDGTCYGVVELSDGRFVAWESWWDATGSGFSEDAYGGDADFGIARTEESARGFISAKTRQSCASADRT